jgi:hypothetical protein
MIYRGAFVTIVIAAALVRLPGIFNDLWLDEIWSLNFAEQAGSACEIFTKYRHDNNHWLNTLYLYFLGATPWRPAYRLLALATGTATVAAVGLAAHSYGRTQALFSMVLSGGSFILVEYSSEARGYAPAACFAVLAFWLMDRFLNQQRWIDVFGFWVCAVLGFLAHLTFLYVFIGLVSWSGRHILRQTGSRFQAYLQLGRLHAVPIAFLAVLCGVAMRGMVKGGGNAVSVLDVLAQLSTWTIGIPLRDDLGRLVLPAVIVLILYESYRLYGEKSDHWLFYLTALLLAPAVLLPLFGTDYLYPRYFLVIVPFVLILLGRFLARLLDSSWLGRGLVLLALSVFILANGWSLGRFFRAGRGHYLDALRYMAEQTPGRQIVVGSDHDFRNEMVLTYYQRNLPAGKELVYCPQDRWSRNDPEWFLRHDFEESPQVPVQFVSPDGRTCTLVQTFPYYGLSGWNWSLYHRVDRGKR